MKPKPLLAAYYFPNWHEDPRNAQHHGPGWTEWEMLKCARPRFDGHPHPRVPTWGHEDEADPAVMARKIDAAADHGLDAFLFDWYWYDGPFLRRCLDEGFLGAANVDRLKFGIMWANHDWVDLFPCRYAKDPFAEARLLYPARVDPPEFDRVCDGLIDRYFSHPSYLLIDGCPYLSLYSLERFMAGFDSTAAAADAVARLRERVRAAGFPDLHLNAIVWGSPILPGDGVLAEPEQVAERVGFDSVGSYVWIHHQYPDRFPATPYERIRRRYTEHWDEITQRTNLPYHPNVTVGWDPSPRTVQSDMNFASETPVYPYGGVIVDNTPAAFAAALRETLDRVEREAPDTPLVTINAWNEWTEGSYLEPDTLHGHGYLEAVRDAVAQPVGGRP